MDSLLIDHPKFSYQLNRDAHFSFILNFTLRENREISSFAMSGKTIILIPDIDNFFSEFLRMMANLPEGDVKRDDESTTGNYLQSKIFEIEGLEIFVDSVKFITESGRLVKERETKMFLCKLIYYIYFICDSNL